jgi:sterol desaturase/sphingolipid hydroxylase (fatty acid hydroxylase superfamily)
MNNNKNPAPPRSWLAYISAGLGAAGLLAVLAFHFPEVLTSRDFRAAYSEQFARGLLLFALVVAFAFGTLSVLRRRSVRVALTGVCFAAIATFLGGATIPVDTIRDTPFSLGLDWFVISLFFSALVFIPIERHLAVRQLSPLRAEWRTDLAYFFVSHVLVQFILIAVTASTSAVAAFVLFPSLKATIQSWPVWVQFLLAVFFADLFQAGLHRIYHRVPFLWRFHAVHHSSRNLDWLAGSRVHFVEIVLTRSAVLLPLVLLGFSQPAVNAYVILVGVQAVLAHANLRTDFGWLEYLLVTPRYHHWHHARHAEYVDVNYAIHLPLVDMIMGTFRRPPPGAWPDEYGVMKLETVPRGIWAQTLMPLGTRKTYTDHVGAEGPPAVADR